MLRFYRDCIVRHMPRPDRRGPRPPIPPLQDVRLGAVPAGVPQGDESAELAPPNGQAHDGTAKAWGSSALAALRRALDVVRGLGHSPQNPRWV